LEQKSYEKTQITSVPHSNLERQDRNAGPAMLVPIGCIDSRNDLSGMDLDPGLRKGFGPLFKTAIKI
jgi:hypothetical protein